MAPGLLLTGLTGTVAPALARTLRERGHAVIPWNHHTDPPDSAGAVRAFIERHRPSHVAHIATGPPDWAQWIAETCAAFSVPLLWAGSVSVFSEHSKAPLTPDMTPDATDDYGKYKIDCERRVLTANPRAIVARLGWQIDDLSAGAPAPPTGRQSRGTNTMTHYFQRLADASAGGGRFEASRRWVPSCAFLGDSASAMAELLDRAQPGVYHLEGNSEGLSHFDIATRLNQRLARGWSVVAADTPLRDNRMHDPRVAVAQVSARL